MNFQLETGVRQTTGKRGRKPTEFPLDQMDVGVSFLIPCNVEEKQEVDSWRRKLLVAKKRFAETLDEGDERKFTTAVVNSDEQGTGLRVWRTQ